MLFPTRPAPASRGRCRAWLVRSLGAPPHPRARNSPATRLSGSQVCLVCLALCVATWRGAAAERSIHDPQQALERTCFQTSQPFGEHNDLRSDVAIVYGIDAQLPDRLRTWSEHGYRTHVMTGVSWGHYQDYLYGRFDGVNHEDEAQTDRNGRRISHGGDVYYMCPGQDYGKFLCVGVQRALEAGAEAIHLEEPEFWVRSGYSAGFKREWKQFYGEDWTPPDASVDAQWRASKLKYYLYRRALQQVFDFVQAYNREHGGQVRCYVPTHSLLNYAHWRIVSPESSLARLEGCDGYIAQVWTGTSRTPNVYRGQLRERTFETAFLEYGAMQNLVRATRRRVWYLNDPVEDNPNHDWDDYRRNWESTLTASLLQPAVWRFEVMPWPERVFGGRYPSRSGSGQRETIPPAYATELQVVLNALNDLNQEPVRWDCGTERVGVMVGDSMMFERGEPGPGDAHLGEFYGLALPLLERGLPVEPVQLESLTIPSYLDRYDVILMTYQGMKPLTPEVHAPLARWVKGGGALVFFDDDRDAYNRVREWWNRPSNPYTTPRQHLFEQLGLGRDAQPGRYRVGRGVVCFRAADPAQLAGDAKGPERVMAAVREAMTGSRARWRETNYLLLRRGPYVIGAGLTESGSGPAKVLLGRFVDLFDPELRVQTRIDLSPGRRFFLLDLARVRGGDARILASACKARPLPSPPHQLRCDVEGVAHTQALVLVRLPRAPRGVTLEGTALAGTSYDPATRLLRVRFANESRARELAVDF